MKKHKQLFIILLAFTLIFTMTACGGRSNTASQPAPNDTSTTQKNTETNQPVAQEKPFYQGKSLEMLVPFGAGGGSDVSARFFAPFYTKFIEGNPSVQVVNVPGGGSINGANEFINLRKSNGEFVLWTSASTVYPYLLREPAVQYELKELQPVVGMPTGAVVYISPSTGYNQPKDILNPSEKLIYAGISATGLDLVTLLAFEVIGVDVLAILGYEGRGPARVAFEQGESNIDYQTTSAYVSNVEPLVGENKAIPLFSVGQLDGKGNVVRDPAFPDILSIAEFYKEVHGTEPSGTAWNAYKTFLGTGFAVQKILWMHKDAPQEAVDALREASVAIIADDEFLSAGEEALGGYTPYAGPELQEIIDEMLDIEDSVIDWVLEFLEKYGVSN
jgi:tripartite-type tricarboxylate transporter receptor subunit TctC